MNAVGVIKSRIPSGYSLGWILSSAATLSICSYLLKSPELTRLDSIATLRSTQLVRVRHASEVNWTTLQTTPLYDGSLVEVPLKGETVVSVGKGHSELLEPGSIVRLTRDHHGVLKQELILRRDALSGGVAYRLKSNLGAEIGASVSEVHLLTPFEAVDVDVARYRQLSREIDRVSSNVVSMDYVLGSVRFPNLTLFGAFDDYTVKPTFPPVGALLKAQRNESPCLAFVWTPIPIPGVTYVVEVSKTWGFEFFRSFGADKNLAYVQVSQPSDYFWRVRALLGSQQLVGSPSRFSLYKPPLTPEEHRREALAKRVRQINASIMDVDYCH